MPRYHEMAELAPRDVVARAIAHELEICPLKEPVVYLDMTHLDADHLRKRFPRIFATCLKYNVDLSVDLVPIRPAAHYLMGGVRTNLHGQTSLPGLYAAGEAACTGVHGANRLASNSLLEGLVFGARAGETMRNELRESAMPAHTANTATRTSCATEPDTEPFIQEIQQLMWNKVGIVRTHQGLVDALHSLEAAAERVPEPLSRRDGEARNIHTAALLIVRSALAREESRGAHYRTDCPAHNDAKLRKHSVITQQNIRFE